MDIVIFMVNAQGLEDVLRQVESLREGLDAEIVLQEEESEECGEYHTGWNIPCTDIKIIQPRIAHPDLEKRADARDQLKKIYYNSQWYSAKYAARKVLGIKDKDQLNLWVSKLKQQLNAEIVIQEETLVPDPYREPGDSYRGWIVGKPRETKPDLEKINKANLDLQTLNCKLMPAGMTYATTN